MVTVGAEGTTIVFHHSLTPAALGVGVELVVDAPDRARPTLRAASTPIVASLPTA